MQHTLFSHCDVSGVGKVNKSSDHLGADITQGDLWSVALFEAAGKHGSEVGATRGQYHFMDLMRKKACDDKGDTGNISLLWIPKTLLTPVFLRQH